MIKNGIFFDMLLYRILNLYLKIYCWIHRYYNYKINLSPLKINLGCGLKIANGWINVDYNLPSLFSNSPIIMKKKLYRVLKAVRYSLLDVPNRYGEIKENEFLNILENNNFICANLLYNIPIKDNCVDYYYSSHMFGFSFSHKEALLIFDHMYRTLKNNGKIRLSLVDGDLYWKSHKKPIVIKRNSNYNCYSFNEVRLNLEMVGFKNIVKMRRCIGKVPDLEKLDDYTDEFDQIINEHTMYIEAEK
jgi:predicted SAM-dependent methyltransferase